MGRLRALRSLISKLRYVSTSNNYPAWAADGNTLALWQFNESSGNVLDSVASLELTKNGSPTYSAVATAPWTNLSPGITTSTGAYFTAAANAQCDFGTSDITIEVVAKIVNTGTNHHYFASFYDGTNKGYEFEYNKLAQTLVVYLEATDGTFVTVSKASGSELVDSTIHKYRWSGSRAGNMTTYLDGVSLGTASIAALSGKTIKAGGMHMFADSSNGNNIDGTMYALKISNSASTNSGGPGGG